MLSPKGMLLKSLGILILLLAFASQAWAQCAMCKASAATRGPDGELIHPGLNTGILYLLALPFLLVAVIGVVWYRKSQALDRADSDASV